MTDEPYTIRMLERIGDVSAAAWDTLVGEDSSPFVEHRWLLALEETGCVGGDTGWLPAHFTVWRHGELVAAAPSYVKGNSEGEFVFDWAWADYARRQGIRYYPKIVVAVPFTPATGDRVLVAPGEDRARAAHLIADAAREWCKRVRGSGVHVLFSRADEAAAWASRGYLRRDGFQFHWFRHDARTFDDYLARFTSKQRNQIKRELRGVGTAGVTVETLAPEHHTHAVARQMHALYASTIDKHGMWGRLYLTEAFFYRVIDVFRDRLAWVVAREGGAPGGTDGRDAIVAGAFNVVRGRRLYGRYWGTRVDVPFLHFVVCYYEGIRHCLERGIDIFEPGAGGEHKRVRGFVPTVTHSAHWLADPRLRAALTPWLEQERARVAGIVSSGGGDDSD